MSACQLFAAATTSNTGSACCLPLGEPMAAATAGLSAARLRTSISLPLVSLPSNHSTVTLKVASLKPDTTAACTRPAAYRMAEKKKKTKKQEVGQLCFGGCLTINDQKYDMKYKE